MICARYCPRHAPAKWRTRTRSFTRSTMTATRFAWMCFDALMAPLALKNFAATQKTGAGGSQSDIMATKRSALLRPHLMQPPRMLAGSMRAALPPALEPIHHGRTYALRPGCAGGVNHGARLIQIRAPQQMLDRAD